MTKPFLHHVHLICNDLQPMVDFWVKGLGGTFGEFRQFGGADGAVVDLNSATKLFLKVLPCGAQESPTTHAGTEHLGIVVENLDATLAHIQTLPGCSVTKEPFVSGSLRCAFIAGPEGVVVEVMEQQ